MTFRHAAQVTCISLLASTCGEPEGTALGGSLCIEESTVLTGLDAASAVGFTAADVLATVMGTHMAAMRWSEPLEDGSVKLMFGPETGDSELTVTIDYEGGEIRYVDSQPAGNPPPEFATGCPDHLEITVTTTLHSEGGALSETIVTPLRATTRDVAVLVAQIPFSELQGSLAPAMLAPPNAQVDPLDLTIGVGPAGLFGSASSTIVFPVGDSGSVAASLIDIARWPIESRCEASEAPIGLDDAIAGFSAADALAVVAAAGDLSLTWQGGPPATMTFALEPDGSPVCATYRGDAFGALRLFADAIILTDDGSWNGSIPVEVVVSAGGHDDLGLIEVRIPQFTENTIAAADFVATYGLHGVDFGDYATVAFNVTGWFLPGDGDVTVQGEVGVFGFKQNLCPDPSSGCAGTDLVPLATGTWGTPRP